MAHASQHSIESLQHGSEICRHALATGVPPDFVPLHEERRTHISTRLMCAHMGRAEQTARGWACNEDGPLRPIRIGNRLAWPVADIKRLLGVA